jgi:hypothetical protein
MMLPCLIPKIPHSEKRKGKTPSLHWKGSTNTTYERPKRVIQKGTSEFYFENIQKLQNEG